MLFEAFLYLKLVFVYVAKIIGKMLMKLILGLQLKVNHNFIADPYLNVREIGILNRKI